MNKGILFKCILVLTYFCSRVLLVTPEAFEQKQKRLIIQVTLPQFLSELNGNLVRKEKQDQKQITSQVHQPVINHTEKKNSLVKPLQVSITAYMGHYIDPPKLS